MPEKQKTILNYTTDVEARRTASEILAILVDAGAQGVSLEFDKDKQPVAIVFSVEVNGRLAAFRLPSAWRGVHKILVNNTRIERKQRTEEQARRVAWRIVKDWIEAQLAIVQAQVAKMAEVFLPYMLDPRTNQSLYEEFESGILLGPGREETVEGEYEEK